MPYNEWIHQHSELQLEDEETKQAAYNEYLDLLEEAMEMAY